MLAMVLLILLVTGITILSDFMHAEFSTDIFSDAYYWIQTLSMQTAVIILMFVSRSMAKEHEQGNNAVFKSLQEALRKAYVTLNAENLNGEFKAYIDADNRARKLKAYRKILEAHASKYSDRISRLALQKQRIEMHAEVCGKTARGLRYGIICRRIAKAENGLAFWNRKLDRAEKDVDVVRVKYIRYSYTLLFSDTKERLKESDDPYVHEGRDIAVILLSKGLSILAVGFFFTSYISPGFVFDIGLIYKTVFKLLQIVLALYAGGMNGQDFIRQMVCAKLTIRCNYVKQFMEQRKGVVADPAPAAIVPSQPV